MKHEEEQDETVNCGLGMAERELLQGRLRDLPDTVPPRVVWERIQAQGRAEGLLRGRGVSTRAMGLLGAGLAAGIAVLVLLPRPPGNVERGGETFPTEPTYAAEQRPVRLNTLNALMVESRQIEEDLYALPSEPKLLRAGTAATIAALEDQVAAIDYRLAHADARLTPAEEEAYWRERVRLMNLLLELRTAQARRAAF